MRFTIHGPYRIKKSSNGLIKSDASTLGKFWQSIQAQEDGLPDACGCYLFAVKATHGIRPWYIGLTSKRSFEVECLRNHQLKIYDNVVASKRRTPLLYFIAKRTKGGKFGKPSKNSQKDIGYLETLPIGTGLEKNRHLQNTRKTKYSKGMIVPGFLNSPRRRPFKAEQSFALALLRD
jgi:hypothetical protein